MYKMQKVVVYTADGQKAQANAHIYGQVEREELAETLDHVDAISGNGTRVELTKDGYKHTGWIVRDAETGEVVRNTFQDVTEEWAEAINMIAEYGECFEKKLEELLRIVCLYLDKKRFEITYAIESWEFCGVQETSYAISLSMKQEKGLHSPIYVGRIDFSGDALYNDEGTRKMDERSAQALYYYLKFADAEFAHLDK